MTSTGRRLRRQTQHDHLRAAFERFVATSAPGLLRLAYLVVWDLPAAEDLVQECYVRIARRWARVQKMDRPDAYARRVLVHLAIDGAGRHRRRQGELDRRVCDPAVAHDPGVGTSFATVDLRRDLVHALGALAPRQRAVLVLRYFADMTEEQVAGCLHCSVGNVKSTASRALDRLRQHYDVHPAATTSFQEDLGNGQLVEGSQENGHHGLATKASGHAPTRT